MRIKALLCAIMVAVFTLIASTAFAGWTEPRIMSVRGPVGAWDTACHSVSNAVIPLQAGYWSLELGQIRSYALQGGLTRWSPYGFC